MIALFLPVAAMVPSIAFPLLVAQGFVGSFTVLLYNITQVTFRQRITPPRLLGRMNASVRFVVWGVMPIAALLSGALGTWLGVVPTMWIGAIGQLSSPPCSSSSVRSGRCATCPTSRRTNRSARGTQD